MIGEANNLRCAVQTCDAVLIAAGAGMGVESGLPDFRGREGLWRAYPALRDLDLRFEDAANPRWFQEEPALAWAFYGHRLHLYRQASPHAGFAALLRLCREKRDRYFVVTSNVDGQFQKAGLDEARMLEVHGSIMHLQCMTRCRRHIWPVDPAEVVVDGKFRAMRMPRCPQCGSIARPNILMFGDDGWVSERADAQWARYRRWLNDLWSRRKHLLVIEIGAGAAIPTIRHITEQLHREMEGAMLVRINPEECCVPPRAIALKCGAVEGIGALVRIGEQA